MTGYMPRLREVLDQRSAGAKKNTRHNRAAVEERGTADEHEDESEGLHTTSVSRDKEFTLPRNNSPQKYYVKLKRRLSDIGVRYERLTKKTPEGSAPPCFTMVKADFDSWLGAASLTTDIPYRYDLPGEPNYCRDCTIGYKHRATLAGKCLFPNVSFETAQSNGEKEVVGVSRSPQVAPTGYRVYRGLLVDEDAVDE